MSKLDKTIRLIVAGIWIFAFGFVCQSWWWLVGLLPLLSAVYGYCPLYNFKAICPICKYKAVPHKQALNLTNSLV